MLPSPPAATSTSCSAAAPLPWAIKEQKLLTRWLAYRVLTPSPPLLPALHTIQLLPQIMQLFAALRFCAHSSDTVDGYCAGAAFATHAT